MYESKENKDSIPRAGIGQILEVLSFIAGNGGKTTFDQNRQFLYETSKRQAPPSSEIMWTVARDVLTDLERLGFLRAGILPRKRSEVHRLGETPCQITESGAELAQIFKEKRSQAFDRLLVTWMNSHPYFRKLTQRLLRMPLYLPDITSIKQLGADLVFPVDPANLSNRVITDCLSRLTPLGFSDEKRSCFAKIVEARIKYLQAESALGSLNAKKLVDMVEDNVVVPAILETEGLSFDSVTFQHLLSCSKEFYSASSMSAHLDFSGRVVFSTCDFLPDIGDSLSIKVYDVIHHGKSFAQGQFIAGIVSAYRRLAGSSSDYVDIYPLRALVCVNLRIQPQVFAICFEQLIETGSASGLKVYTELPFAPPPRGESYVEVRKHRIGLLKVLTDNGG